MANSELHGYAQWILRIISRRDGEVSTNDITSETGLKNNLAGHHIDNLIERGYVDKVGTVDTGAPIPANTYDVTPAGEEKAQELRVALNEQPDVGGDESARISELEETVEILKRENEKLRERLDNVEETVEGRADAIQYLLDKEKERSGKR